MRSAATFLFIALLACGPPKSGDDTQGEGSTSTTTNVTGTVGHSSTPTTSGPADGSADAGPGDGSASPTFPDHTSTTSTTAPPETTDPTGPMPPNGVTTGIGGDSVPIFPEETDGSFLSFPADLPPGDCSPWTEDCPDGQKCMPAATPGSPTWDTFVCVPIVVDPAPPGAPCVVLDSPTSGLDSCEKHAMCWAVDDATLQGQCVALCLGNKDDQFCKHPAETCVMANDNVLPVCLPECNPLIVNCPEAQVCIPSVDVFACAPDASGPGGALFSNCTGGNTCDPGLVCADAKNSAQCGGSSDECCLAMCDLDQPDCPAGQACNPWFLGGFMDVGVCADP